MSRRVRLSSTAGLALDRAPGMAHDRRAQPRGWHHDTENWALQLSKALYFSRRDIFYKKVTRSGTIWKLELGEDPTTHEIGGFCKIKRQEAQYN